VAAAMENETVRHAIEELIRERIVYWFKLIFKIVSVNQRINAKSYSFLIETLWPFI
jgi:hypothetical protein